MSFTCQSPIFFGVVLCSHIHESLQMLKKYKITECFETLYGDWFEVDTHVCTFVGSWGKDYSHYELIIVV